MMNEVIFIIQTTFLSLGIIVAQSLGKEALISLIGLLSVLSNILVLKQITLFGFNVTACDAFAVSAMLGINCVQEFYGIPAAYQAIKTSFFCLLMYLIATQIHLWYVPNIYDISQYHFVALFSFMPRIVLASCFSYVTAQYLDRYLYQQLQMRFNRYFLIRNYASLVISQFVDTLLFSFLGLYGIVEHIIHVIFVSYSIKLVTIIISVPWLWFLKKLKILTKIGS